MPSAELSAESSAVSDDEAPRRKKDKRVYQSAQERSGVKFPIARLAKVARFNNKYAPRIGQGAPVFMAGVLEYLAEEILELASAEAVADKSEKTGSDGNKIIRPRHLMLAIRKDHELQRFFGRSEFHDAGRLPAKFADPKSGKKKKAADQDMSDSDDQPIEAAELEDD